MHMKNVLAIILLTFCLATAAACRAEAVGFKVERDVVFAVRNGITLKADVYVPDGAGPFSILVMLHGGGFIRGDKSDVETEASRFASDGFVVFAANYRTLNMGAHYPDFVRDAHTAVRWIWKHAAEYNADPARIAITGFSAGCYIASLTAVTPDVAKLHHEKLDAAELGETHPKIGALVAFYGAHDLEHLDETLMQAAQLIFGSKPSGKKVIEASPAHYMNNAVPTIFFHNTGDRAVPVEQSRMMFEKLKKAGVPTAYYEFPRQAHDLLPDDEKWAIDIAAAFLDKWLNGNKGVVLPESIPAEIK